MAKKRILVIEDDDDLAEMLRHYFGGQGYEILNALNGLDGVSTARAKLPDLILLDIMLPDMDGFDVCRQLRTTPLTKHIPITFLSQRDGRADKVAGLELGADDYITKPFDIEELRLRVLRQMKRAGQETPTDPRSGLPGKSALDDTKAAWLFKDGWRQVDLMLQGLTHYRDTYGFIAADEALGFLGDLINGAITQFGTPDDFAGVNSESHYTILSFAANPQALIDHLNARFASTVGTLYNAFAAQTDPRLQLQVVLLPSQSAPPPAPSAPASTA
jgi:CheY-like chemotaxis protein